MRNRNWSIAVLSLLGAVAGCSGCQQNAEDSGDLSLNDMDAALNGVAEPNVDLGQLAEDAVAETSAELNGQETKATAVPAASEADAALDDLVSSGEDLAGRTEQDAPEAQLKLSNLIEE